MKKFLFTLMFVLAGCISIQAQTYCFRSVKFALKVMYDDGQWSKWSDWKNSNMLIFVNVDKDIIKIKSPKPQVYKIIKCNGYETDPNGESVVYRVIDQDDDLGTVRLRIQKDGTRQLYVEFADMKWVYVVVLLS